jgi:hypothetical protein
LTSWLAPLRGRDQLRSAALVATLLLCSAVFADRVYRYAPVQTWLSVRYALYWMLAAIFAAGCLAAGHGIVRALAPSDLPLRDHLVLAFGAGVLAFATLTFLAGIAGLLGGVFFVLAPLLLLAAGGRSALGDLHPRVRAALAHARTALRPAHWVTAVTTLGFVGVVLVYLPVLAPANVSYDARWYHLAIAEQYATDGAIRRFPEGLLAGTYPELATLVYTWAFLLPGGALFDRVELAAHLEFAVFLGTLAGIPSLVRQLVPEVDARWSWAAFFLFPAIFAYDSELCCGADHFAALFAVPIFLALFRAWSGPSPRACALVAIFVAGALSTKYTAASLAIGPSLVMAIRTAQCRAWKGMAAFAATVLAITAQHWLRNWIFYGDPIYPLMAGYFRPHPWTIDSDSWQSTFHAIKTIPNTLLVHGPLDLVRILATFSFDVHVYPYFHSQAPVFGSLFTFATVALPFLRSTRRAWAVALATYVGMTYWALLTPQDRYLQALLPWMVGVTTATLILAWRIGRAARAAVCGLVGLQLVATHDVYFLPSHGMTNAAPVRATLDLLGGRYSNGASVAHTPLDGWPELGRVLPRGARVLLHERDIHLGLGAASVLDLLPFSYGIDYGRQRSMREAYELLRSMGVTHLVWESSSRRADSFAGDLVFFSFASRYGKRPLAVGGYFVASMPDAPPPETPHGSVMVIGCVPGPYESGVYELADLAVPPVPSDSPARYPRPRQSLRALDATEPWSSDAEFAVVDPTCSDIPAHGLDAFVLLAQRGPYRLYARTIGAAASPSN